MESEIEEKLTKQLTIRFTESQLERIKAIAKKTGRKEADLIRFLAMRAIEQMENV